MKKALALIIVLISFTGVARPQTDNTAVPARFIEVTGSAEMEVEPDEIRFIIGIEEYWKEEFEKRAEFKDYKTKIPIREIENNLLVDLQKIGIEKENIIVKEVGNFWRYTGKEFLVSKQLEIVLHDFNKIDQIIKTINTRGVDYMRIGELKNKDITQFRRKVKVEALKAAKEKADYMLGSIDKQTGEVISIVEIDNDNNNYIRGYQLMASNSVMNAPDESGIDNLRKIKLRYEVKARFEIK